MVVVARLRECFFVFLLCAFPFLCTIAGHHHRFAFVNKNENRGRKNRESEEEIRERETLERERQLGGAGGEAVSFFKKDFFVVVVDG